MINSKVLDIKDKQMARKKFAGGLYSPSWLVVCEGGRAGRERGRGRERDRQRNGERGEKRREEESELT